MYSNAPDPPPVYQSIFVPRRLDPLPPKPTHVQWYRDFVPIDECEENQTADGINRYLIPLHRTIIADNQFYLVQVEPGTEAFSLEPHNRIFFFGGRLTPLYQLEEIDQDFKQLLESHNVYAKLITNLGNVFWLQKDKHWHLDLNADGELQIPDTDSDMAHQELEVIEHLYKLISANHLTLDQAIHQLGSCTHEFEEQVAAPWQQLINNKCEKCGLEFAIDEFDPDPDFTQIYDAWPILVERVGHDFTGLIFGGLKDIYLYNFRHIVMADKVRNSRGIEMTNIPTWLDRNGEPIAD